MEARDAMEPTPIWVQADESLMDAAQHMLANPFSTLPVVGNDQGELIGTLSMDDLLPRLEAVPFSEVEALRLFGNWLDENNYNEFGPRYREQTVQDHMHKDVQAVAPDAHLCQALRIIVSSSDHQVFVVDEERRLLGVIGRNDVLAILTSGR
ncbi:MAG: HPP family protein [Candidatus Bipolaricaulia bacterium]